jgi:hypothetical protein
MVGGTNNLAAVYGKLFERRLVTVNEAPPNKCMELTVLLGTRLAKRRARQAPCSPAAHAWR